MENNIINKTKEIIGNLTNKQKDLGLQIIFGCLLFTVFVNNFLFWAIAEKAWYVKWAGVLTGGGVLGLFGCVLGYSLGWLIVIYIPGVILWFLPASWVLGGLGTAAGTLGGGLFTVMQNPGNYYIYPFRLALLVLGSAAASWLITKTIRTSIAVFSHSGKTA